MAEGKAFVGWRPAEAKAPPAWVTYPGHDWQAVSPRDAGLDAGAFGRWVEFVERQHPRPGGYGNDQPGGCGIAVTRAGYLVHTFGAPSFRYQVASTGKLFTDFALILAIDHGLVNSIDDPIREYWTGAGRLDAERKRLDRGHHVKLTFRHLVEHTGAFPVTNGEWWRQGLYGPGQATPVWARCTNDPTADNFAHAEPGTVGFHYSSGGRWRLSQALTAIWQADLKKVLDEHLMGKLGIAAGVWSWLAGGDVCKNQSFYPDYPGYGLFCDPPHVIGAHSVRGGGGWVVIDALNLARIGHLMACGGWWRDERLLSWIPGFWVGDSVGHGGGGGSNLLAWRHAAGGEAYVAYSQVTTATDGSVVPDRAGKVIGEWILSPPTVSSAQS